MAHASRFRDIVGRIGASLFFLFLGSIGLAFGAAGLRNLAPLHLGEAALYLLVALLLTAAGLGAVFYVWRQPWPDPIAEALARASPANEEEDEEEEEEEDTEADRPVASPGTGRLELQPKATPVATAVTWSLVALFLNGYLDPYFFQVFRSFRDGEYGLAIFLSVCLLAALGSLLAAIHALLRLKNPRPHLTLSRGTPRLGETVEVDWRFTGLPARMRRLHITFEGREEADYPSGRSHKTASAVFLQIPVLDETESGSIAAGTARIALPGDTLPTFTAPHNRVIWSLKIAGEIRRWPDVHEEFDITVLPLESKRDR